jgi:hypothetical protein
MGIEGSMLELNKALSEGVQPEDNAVVLLVQIFGSTVFEPELRGGSLDMLGIRSVAKAPRFQYVDAFVRSAGAKTDEAVDRDGSELNASLNTSINGPWTRDEHPRMAAFLDANKSALDLAVIAADRPRYYAPLLSTETPMRLMAGSYAIEHRLPFIGRCLVARAMLSCTEGDYDAAWTDLAACHKLTALVVSGSPLDISAAKAHVVDGQACSAEMGLILSGQLPGAQAESLLAVLSKLPPLPTAEDAANRGERAVIHEELELLRSDEESRKGFFETGTPDDLEQLKLLLNTEAYWKIALATADAQQDKIVKLLSIRPRPDFFAAVDVSNAEFEKWATGEAEQDQEISFAEIARQDPEAAARQIGESIAMALRGNPWQRRHTDDRARLRRDAVTILLALVAYHARHETYPAQLAELAPEIVSEVPSDVHSEQPFVYERRSQDNVVLTSLGANQQNDAGAIYNDDLIVELK